MSKKYDPKAPCWGLLCPVDISPLRRWLQTGPPRWPPVVGNEPNSVAVPDEAQPIIEAVCQFLGPNVGCNVSMISRLVPGVRYRYHSDGQPSNWITRVHVPILTSPKAWFAWEEQKGERVYMEAGWAYSFNTIKAHSYGNEGDSDRVHLIFDALQWGHSS